MKKTSFLFVCIILAFVACKKDNPAANPANAPVNTPLTVARVSSGSGSSATITTALISSIGGAFRLVGGNSDSIQVNFTQPAPSSGWTVSFSASDAAISLPSTFNVPAGEYIIHVPLTSSVITASKNITITVKLGAETKSYVLKVFALHYTFTAPQLQSPGNGAGFKSREQVKFLWSGNANAYYYNVQTSDNTGFINPILEVSLNDPIWAASYFNGLGKRYWRVRYIDASGTPGPWSAINWFEIKG